MDLVELIKMLGIKTLTENQARAICRTVPESDIAEVFGGWARERQLPPIVSALQREFPKFKWRVVQCHDRRQTYFALTIDDPDAREYAEMSRRGSWDTDGVYRPFDVRKASS